MPILMLQLVAESTICFYGLLSWGKDSLLLVFIISLIDLFCLLILFSKYRSCDDTQESIFSKLDIFMVAHSPFNEHYKGSNLLGSIVCSLLGKQNGQTKKLLHLL